MKKWISFIIILSAGLLLAYRLKNHFIVPELPLGLTSLTASDGTTYNPARTNGKFLLVSCFQSWCGDCIREAPSIAALEKFAGKDKLEVLMISDESQEKLERFQALTRTSLPVYRSEKSFDELGIKVYPSTWLLAPDGSILLAKLEGYDWNSVEVQNLIQ
jgi:thiol-disulfide isomerase/thioredoxin